MEILSLSGNSFLRQYLEKNKTLARTLTIKSSVSADRLNDFIRLKYGESAVDLTDPTTWKYYKNICGEYHTLDTPMQIISLDTLETIFFTKQALVSHTATKEAYEFGSRYYYSLLNQYPEQSQLILGILYPCEMQKAVDSEDGTILSYPKYLIENQELTLIEDLQSFIKRYLVRWNVAAFSNSDSLYNTAYHALLYLSIYPKVLNLRLKRCKTSEAHSFHIQQYLASHQGLDSFLPYMTLKQAMYFYRNIAVLERNPGKVDTLRELIQKLLTDRRIPIAEYSIRQKNFFDDNLYPEVTARRRPLNTEFNISEKDYVPPEDLFEKEEKLVYGNAKYYQGNQLNDTAKFKNSLSSVIQTKDLESNMVDYNDAIPDPLERVLLRQWIYMSVNGKYNVVINFKDPKNSEVRSLYVKDALIYYYYILLSSIGLKLESIPGLINIKFRRDPKPSLNDLLSVVDTSIEGIRDTIEDIHLSQPELNTCFSTSMFFNLSYNLYKESERHWFIISNTQDHYTRALVNNAVTRLYGDTLIDLNVQDIKQWLRSKNLPEFDYTNKQVTEILTNIFTEATGLNIDNTKLLKNIQKAMLEILGDLSSYSIQLIREINDSSILPVNWAATRAGNIKVDTEDYRFIETNVRVNDILADTLNGFNINGQYVKLSIDEYHQMQSIRVPIKSYQYSNFEDRRSIEIAYPSFRFHATYDEYQESISQSSTYVGKEFYLLLTDSQKRQLKSIYG